MTQVHERPDWRRRGTIACMETPKQQQASERPVGRPEVGPTVTFRLRPETHEAVTQLAAAFGQKRAAWLRGVVEAEVERLTRR